MSQEFLKLCQNAVGFSLLGIEGQTVWQRDLHREMVTVGCGYNPYNHIGNRIIFVVLGIEEEFNEHNAASAANKAKDWITEYHFDPALQSGAIIPDEPFYVGLHTSKGE